MARAISESETRVSHTIRSILSNTIKLRKLSHREKESASVANKDPTKTASHGELIDTLEEIEKHLHKRPRTKPTNAERKALQVVANNPTIEDDDREDGEHHIEVLRQVIEDLEPQTAVVRTVNVKDDQDSDGMVLWCLLREMTTRSTAIETLSNEHTNGNITLFTMLLVLNYTIAGMSQLFNDYKSDGGTGEGAAQQTTTRHSMVSHLPPVHG